MVNSDEMMEQKVNRLFYQCDSFFEVFKITLQLTFWDVFTVSENKTRAASGFAVGLLLLSIYVVTMKDEKAFFLFLVYLSLGSIFASILLCLVFSKGGFFSYTFYAMGMPLVIGFIPCLTLICGFTFTRHYVSFRHDMRFNYSGRLTGTKGTDRTRL
jgi:hypothetical protein